MDHFEKKQCKKEYFYFSILRKMIFLPPPEHQNIHSNVLRITEFSLHNIAPHAFVSIDHIQESRTPGQRYFFL